MKRSLLLFIFITLTTGMSGGQDTLDSLFRLLDQELKNSKTYDEQRVRVIDSVKVELRYVTSDDLEYRYKLSSELSALYYKFDYDSAMVYTQDMFSLANRMRNRYEINNTRLRMALLLVSKGLFTPAFEELSMIDRKTLDTAQRITYYSIHASNYYGQALFIDDNNYSVKYERMGDIYQDSLTGMLNKGSDEYKIAMSRLLASRSRDYTGAFELLKPVCERADREEPRFAITASRMAVLYGQHYDFDNQKRMLAMAAICNIRNSNKETTSILALSQILYKDGDLDRALLYVRQAWDEVMVYNALHRKVQVSAVLPLIEMERSIQEKVQKKKAIRYAVVVSALAMLTIVLLISLYRQLVKIKNAKKVVEETNGQLARINGLLKEANQIKDKYLIDFFDLCSDYITKMGKWQAVIRKKIKEKKHNELFDMLDPSLPDLERQTLFKAFDSIFLTLFPTFVEELNNLLEPNSRIVPKKTELLNNELRIFSLVRLGITDPVHIAKFLNCSVNTIYTYRTKIKSRAINPNRNEFEKEIMKIGISDEKF